MLLDANILLYAVDSAAPQFSRASRWLTDTLNGDRQVAVPWQTIGAFIRIATHPRVSANPLTGPEAWSFVEEWLDTPVAWVPPATERTARVLGQLIERYHLTSNAVPDAQLAALALEYGLTVISADSDFARFSEVRWENPIQGFPD